MLNGFDLTRIAVGDVVMVNDHAAAMLVREGWADSLGEVSDATRTEDRLKPRARDFKKP
jgi:hypothetical protein